MGIDSARDHQPRRLAVSPLRVSFRDVEDLLAQRGILVTWSVNGSEAGRAGLRLAEDGWRTAEAAPSGRAARRLDRDPRGGRPTTSCESDLDGDVSLTAWVNGGGLFHGYLVAPVPHSRPRHGSLL